MSSSRRLATEFQKLSDNPLPGIVARPRDPGALGAWTFAICGPAGSAYHHGVFCGELFFPADYPLSPPRMIFTTPLTHPNVYGPGAKRGEVCISILHIGNDAFGYERPEERWSPVHSIQSILLSVQSMLHDCNAESPANVDAAKLYTQDPERFRLVCRLEVEASLGLR